MKVSLLPLLCLLLTCSGISHGQIASVTLKYNNQFSDEMTVYIKVRNPSTFRADRAMVNAVPRFKRASVENSRQQLDFRNSNTYALVSNQLNNFDLVETEDDIKISWKSNFDNSISRLELVKYASANTEPEMVQTIHNVDGNSRISFRVSEFNSAPPGLYQIKVYDESGNIIASRPKPSKSKEYDKVSIYPKATPNEIMISQIPLASKATIKVLDSKGQECLAKSVNTDKTFINLSTLKSGNYKITIQSGDFRYEESVVKL